MKVQQSYPLPVSEKLLAILEKEIKTSKESFQKGIILNFRDPKYSQENGGFHPVEIAICELGKINYITDFSYVGMPPFADLEKELDFDFSRDVFQSLGCEYSISKGKELYLLWENNFCDYYSMRAYQVTVGSFR